MRKVFSFIGIALAISSSAQNLVVNPFFIPSKDSKTEAQLYLAKGFSNPNRGTTDLYSRTASSHAVGIPENFVGTQEIVGSDHYAGIISYYDDLTLAEGGNGLKTGYGRYSEYLQVELREPLAAGSKYTVSFDASLSENSGFASTLGFYFSNTKLNEANNQSLPYTAQFQTQEVITDTEKWVPVSTTYTAKGGERFITVGRFNDKVKLVAKPNQENNRRAYYYLSNVVVSKIEESSKENEPTTVISTDLPTVYFATNSYTIDEKSMEKLNNLIGQLNNNPKLRVTIEGHTDVTGGKDENEVLAAKRANTVKAYLASKGITEDRMNTKTIATRRLADKKGPANNPKNRRVTLSVE